MTGLVPERSPGLTITRSFWLGELPGLLIGLAIASTCGYAVVVIALAGHGLRVLRGDLAYTALNLISFFTVGQDEEYEADEIARLFV